jgi:hypothetical protein
MKLLASLVAVMALSGSTSGYADSQIQLVDPITNLGVRRRGSANRFSAGDPRRRSRHPRRCAVLLAASSPLLVGTRLWR